MRIYIVTLLILIAVAGLNAQMPWQQVTSAGVTLKYRVTMDGAFLENQISASTTGWVSVGYRPVNTMQGANIIIGYVVSGNASIRDDWGVSQTSHSSDLVLGGQNNVQNISGTELGGVTTLNFRIPLNSGDAYDKLLTTGTTYPIILARGSNGSDNFTSYHAGAGFSNINIAPPVLATPIASMSFNGNTLRLAWNQVPNANAYKVLRSSEPNGVFALWQTTSSNLLVIPTGDSRWFYQVKAVYQ